MWNNRGRNIKPDQTEFVDMGLLTEDDSAFNIEDCTVFKKLLKVYLNG